MLFLNGTIKIVHTAPWPHYPHNMSLSTIEIYSTISPPLSCAMEDCFIVRVQPLRMLHRRRCCMSASQRIMIMFVIFWKPFPEN